MMFKPKLFMALLNVATIEGAVFNPVSYTRQEIARYITVKQ